MGFTQMGGWSKHTHKSIPVLIDLPVRLVWVCWKVSTCYTNLKCTVLFLVYAFFFTRKSRIQWLLLTRVRQSRWFFSWFPLQIFIPYAPHWPKHINLPSFKYTRVRTFQFHVYISNLAGHHLLLNMYLLADLVGGMGSQLLFYRTSFSRSINIKLLGNDANNV